MVIEKIAHEKKDISLSSYAKFLVDTFVTKQNQPERSTEMNKLRKLEATQTYTVLEEEKEVVSKRNASLVRVPAELYDKKYTQSGRNPSEPQHWSTREPHRFDNHIYEKRRRTEGGIGYGMERKQRRKVLGDSGYINHQAEESKEQNGRMGYEQIDIDQPKPESSARIKDSQATRKHSPRHKPGDSVVILNRAQAESSDDHDPDESLRIISKAV